MRRLLLSILVGALLGVLAGFLLGWVIAPVQYVDSPLDLLARPFKETYTVMVAAAFRQDRDLDLVRERLQPLAIDNIPSWVQDVTERYISQGRNVNDITDLVALAEAFGRLTPIMEPYRLQPSTGAE
ncbi:MAG: hypothetical protein M5R40_09015 [Anaerolineae bacterium]|nr:hypothetical protein [Anaerolineae bacterium]